MNRAVFLDRDGVINRKAAGNGYITDFRDMHFLPGVAEAITLLHRAGFQVIVVSNQRCVANGLITSVQLDEIHGRMTEHLAAAGAVIDEIFYCPHEEQPPCGCRKPAPGMLLEAARKHQINLPASWMVGDAEIDVDAGKRAGCKTARLLSSNQTANGNADVIASSLLDATHQILKLEGTASDPSRVVLSSV